MSTPASSLNWWYIDGSFFLMWSARRPLDPGDVEEHAAVRAAAAGLDLALMQRATSSRVSSSGGRRAALSPLSQRSSPPPRCRPSPRANFVGM
jgi:hypothetical protein